MDNKTKLQRMGAKDLYYHSHYDDRSRATVCLVEIDSLVVARGIALCSPKDQYLKRKGRAIALGRAMKAIYHGYNVYPLGTMKHSALGQALLTGYNFKGEWMPELTAYEGELVHKVKRAVPVGIL